MKKIICFLLILTGMVMANTNKQHWFDIIQKILKSNKANTYEATAVVGVRGDDVKKQELAYLKANLYWEE